MKKSVTPAAHGVIDYIFSGMQLAGPALLGLNDTVRKTYLGLGSGFALVNALTQTPLGIKPIIPFRGHQKADLGFLTSLALLSAAPFVRKNKKALLFHLGFLAVAVTHYLLTDYDAKGSDILAEKHTHLVRPFE